MHFFFDDTATTEIYTLSLHDALPICGPGEPGWRERAARRRLDGVLSRSGHPRPGGVCGTDRDRADGEDDQIRSEEHTSELQSRRDLVCRLLLEKKKKKATSYDLHTSI